MGFRVRRCSSCSAFGPGMEWASWGLPFRRKGSVQTAGRNGAASHPTLPTAPRTPAADRRMQLPCTGSGTSLTRSSCPVNDLAASFLRPGAALACPLSLDPCRSRLWRLLEASGADARNTVVSFLSCRRILARWTGIRWGEVKRIASFWAFGHGKRPRSSTL